MPDEVVIKLTIHQAVIAYTELVFIDGSEYGIVRAAQSGAKRIAKALWKAGYDTQGNRHSQTP